MKTCLGHETPKFPSIFLLLMFNFKETQKDLKHFRLLFFYFNLFEKISYHLASICVDNQYCIKVGWLHPSPLRLPALNRRTSKESSCSPNYIKVNILMYTYSNEGQRYVGARQLYLFHRDGTDSMFSPSCLSPYR